MRSGISRLSSKSNLARRYLTTPLEKRISQRKPGDLALLLKELKPQIDTSKEYSTQEAMKLLGLSEPAIQNYCKTGVLKAERRGKKLQWFINGKSLQEALFMNARRVPLTEATNILADAGHPIAWSRVYHFAKKKGFVSKTPHAAKGIDFFDLNKLRQEFSMAENSLSVKAAARQIGLDRGWMDPLIRKGFIQTVVVRGLKKVPNYEIRRLLAQKERQLSFKEAINELIGLDLPRFGYHAAWDTIHRAGIIEKGITGAKAVDKEKLASLKQDILRKRNLREESQQKRQKQKEEKTKQFRDSLEQKRKERTEEKRALLARANIQPGDGRYEFLLTHSRVSAFKIRQNMNLIQELTGSTNLRGFGDYLWRSKKYIRNKIKILQKGLQKRDELQEVNARALATPVGSGVIKIAQSGTKLSSAQLMNLMK